MVSKWTYFRLAQPFQDCIRDPDAKHQIPSSKSQGSFNIQTPILHRLGYGGLVIEASLEFGVWDLVLRRR